MEALLAEGLSAETDEEVILRCRDAAPAEIRECVGILARRYERPLLRYLTTLVGDRTAAEDLLQEAFVRVYKNARGYREIAKFRTWVYKIATNLAINELRNRGYRPTLALNRPLKVEGGGAELVDAIAGRERDPGLEASRRDLQALVQGVVASLPEIYRAVLHLCDIEERSYEEAAEVLEINTGTVRSRLFRARAKFEEKMAPYLRREDPE